MWGYYLFIYGCFGDMESEVTSREDPWTSRAVRPVAVPSTVEPSTTLLLSLCVYARLDGPGDPERAPSSSNARLRGFLVSCQSEPYGPKQPHPEKHIPFSIIHLDRCDLSGFGHSWLGMGHGVELHHDRSYLYPTIANHQTLYS